MEIFMNIKTNNKNITDYFNRDTLLINKNDKLIINDILIT